MSKQKAAGETATANGARAPSNIASLMADFTGRKAALTTLEEAYPAALAAIEEYAGSYVAEGGKGRSRRLALQLCNDTACVGDGRWHPYAAAALASLAVNGDLPGDAVPADVAAGLSYLRHNAPAMFNRLVAMDAALPAALPLSCGDFASSALLMRSALAIAQSAALAA